MCSLKFLQNVKGMINYLVQWNPSSSNQTLFQRFHNVQQVIANNSRLSLFSWTSSTSSTAEPTAWPEFINPLKLLCHTSLSSSHSHVAWSEDSGSFRQRQHVEFDKIFLWTRLHFVGSEFVQAFHRKVFTLFRALNFHSFFQKLFGGPAIEVSVETWLISSQRDW